MPQWSCIGPTKVDWSAPTTSLYATTQGVIRSVTQDPNDPNKIFAGSVSAGIWLSQDNGSTWECVTKNLLVDQVKGIAICPKSSRKPSAATADSQETVGENGRASNAIDGDLSTFWHTQWYNQTDPLPHHIDLDLGSPLTISGLTYLPRQDGSENGHIKDYEIYVSNDGTNWEKKIEGTWTYSTDKKTVNFEPATATHVRLQALSEVNDQPFTSAAEIEVLGSFIMYAAAEVGPIKSTDGGLTWNYPQDANVNWTSNYPNGPEPKQIIVHPDNPDIAIFACNSGIWRTENGGQNWIQEFNREVWDIEFHPTNPDIVYAGVSNGNPWNSRWIEFYRSTDGGANWTNITNGYPTPVANHNLGRICIAVTPAAPEHVYVFAGGGQNMGQSNQQEGARFFRSTDSGTSFTEIDVPNMIDYDTSGNGTGGGQYTWDMDLAVSNTDSNYLLAGGINVWKSTDGGNNWSYVPGTGDPQGSNRDHWYHSDVQSLAIYDNKSWITSDGGIYLSTDQCANISNKSFGIVAQEIWGFDQGWKSDIMAIGMYHGPIQIRDDSIYDGWYASTGADAGTAMVNKGDDKYIYCHPWNDNKITRSDDKDTKPIVVGLNARMPSYIYPIEIFNHNYYNTFYTLDTKESTVQKTKDNAKSWELLKDFGGDSDTPVRITTSYSNADVAYVIVEFNQIWKTRDGGINWTQVTPNSIVTQNKSFSNLTIDGEDPNIVWVSMGGKQKDVKVIKTTDGGATWSDYSGPNDNLPSYEIHVITHQIGTNGGVYIGTDAGLWYRNNSLDRWQRYSTNLPLATRVYFIRLNYAKNKIRIGTHRGLWECDLYEASRTIANPMAEAKEPSILAPVQFVDHSVAREGATYQWQFPGGNPSSSTEEKPQVIYHSLGNYDVTLTVTDVDGTTDTKTVTDFITVSVPSNSHLTRISPSTATADSQETVGENGRTSNAIDGNSSTIWHTQWYNQIDALPHYIDLDLDATYTVVGLTYLPRQDGSENGHIQNYEVYVSNDGTNWEKKAEGTWTYSSDEKTVYFPTVSTRYVRLRATSSVNDNQFTSAAELQVIVSPSKLRPSTATADSQQSISESADKAIDGDSSTIWHTQWYPQISPLPHHIDLDLGETYTVVGLTYLPRQDGSQNGNIQNYEVYVSNDGNSWQRQVGDTWTDSSDEKTVHFPSISTRYVRLRATSEVNGNQFTSAAEINVLVLGQ
ncbi:MAG: PKD domain-containing protein [Symploca sp. SIO3C6]|nr:PKD domain-containing protein [Symploca sp. SIO3C6]